MHPYDPVTFGESTPRNGDYVACSVFPGNGIVGKMGVNKERFPRISESGRFRGVRFEGVLRAWVFPSLSANQESGLTPENLPLSHSDSPKALSKTVGTPVGNLWETTFSFSGAMISVSKIQVGAAPYLNRRQWG